MSRKVVIAAVELAATGNVQDAARMLRANGEALLSFARRRLPLIRAEGGELSAAAEAVWQELFGVPMPVSNQQPASLCGGADAVDEPDEFSSGPLSAEVLPDFVTIEKPAAFLQLLSHEGPREIDLRSCTVIQAWAVAALAVERTHGRAADIIFGEGGASRFAHALGLGEVVEGRAPTVPLEHDRTVRLTRLQQLSEIDDMARQIARLIFRHSPHDASASAVQYVLVELLRNAVQHSHDAWGCFVAAQRQAEQQRYEEPRVQVVVADGGRGVFESLRANHPDVTTPEAALTKALAPYISGTFREGGEISGENAGIGLFMVSEIAKRTGGSMLLASRGAALLVRGDPDDPSCHKPELIRPRGVGFPGTLVAFDMPEAGVAVDWTDLFEHIKDLASTYRSRHGASWIQYPEVAPTGIPAYLVSYVAENTAEAIEIARKNFVPAVDKGRPLLLDFRNIDISTQSFVHALLYHALRAAWARKTPVYAINVSPAVKVALRMLEDYALL